MGNCASQKKPKSDLMNSRGEKAIKHITTSVSDVSKGKRDVFTDVMIQSHVSDQGDRRTSRTITSPKFASRIPVRTANSRKTSLSRSSTFLRLSQSRIPVNHKTQCPLEYMDPLKALNLELERSQSQLNESGFVSDFSVTNSGSSQPCVDVKDDRHSSDASEERVIIGSDLLTNKKTDAGSTLNPIIKQVSTVSDEDVVDSYSRRPKSLSCESELILRKIHSKRTSELSENNQMSSPSPMYPEHSGVLQEVSQLKLMLHKLRRSLLTDTTESPHTDSLFRPSTPISAEIKLISRDELELKYEKLLTRNVHLERLLESRERVIAQLQSERDSRASDPAQRMSNQSNNLFVVSPRNYRAISDIPPLQCGF